MSHSPPRLPLLEEETYVRAKFDALILSARAALMLGDETGARRFLDRVRSYPEFETEELYDCADLRRFLDRSR